MFVKQAQMLIKKTKMTLRSYYENLERPTPPKKEFIQKVSKMCGVDPYTVRLWITGKAKPSRVEYIEVLEEVTGIKKEELFDNE